MSLAYPKGEDKLHRPLTKGLDLDTTYNAIYVHLDPGYISPKEFEDFYLRQISIKEAA